MNTLWMYVGAGTVAIVALMGWVRRRQKPVELGSVSHQWIAERRMSQTEDPQR